MAPLVCLLLAFIFSFVIVLKVFWWIISGLPIVICLLIIFLCLCVGCSKVRKLDCNSCPFRKRR
jgi:hypothetical protein